MRYITSHKKNKRERKRFCFFYLNHYYIMAQIPLRLLLRNRRGAMAPRRRRFKKGYKGFQGSRWKPHVSLCPDRMFVKLKYTQDFKLTSVAGAIAVQAFRGNSVTDPDVTSPGQGATAYGVAQWANFYDRHYVSSCNAELRITPEDDFSSRVVLYPTTFSTAPTNIDNATNHARMQFRLLNGGEGTKKIKARFSTKGVTGEPWNIDQTAFLASSSSPPASQWFWQVAMAGIPQSSPPASASVTCSITLTYNVILYGRNQALSQSGGSSS